MADPASAGSRSRDGPVARGRWPAVNRQIIDAVIGSNGRGLTVTTVRGLGRQFGELAGGTADPDAAAVGLPLYRRPVLLTMACLDIVVLDQGAQAMVDAIANHARTTGPEPRRGGLVSDADPAADVGGGAWQLADDGPGRREGLPGDPVVMPAQQQLGGVRPGPARRHRDTDRRLSRTAAGAAGQRRGLSGNASAAVADPLGRRGVPDG